jgi:hypothetical protein
MLLLFMPIMVTISGNLQKARVLQVRQQFLIIFSSMKMNNLIEKP